ncbi:MAG: MarR family winged helix-turn-helix transcriptional regulator [Pyrinomonadaceae bacterium]
MEDEIIFQKTISFLLARVTTAYKTVLERHMGLIGLHAGQVFLLVELWMQDGLRQVDLARRMSLSAPTVNKMIKGLVEINLVTLSREEGDGRSTRIFLTEQGYAIRDDVDVQWLELETNYLADLTDTERLILPDLLSKLRNAYTGSIESEDE